MRSLNNPFCFFVQVCKYPSLHSGRSRNVCVPLFRFPLMLSSIILKCVNVLKLLLLSGDVELNPGPNQSEAILAAIAALSTKTDTRHTEMMEMLTELTTNQRQLEQKVSDLTTRLAAVESLVESLDMPQEVPDLSNVVSEAVRGETVALNSRLDELEDRSRRDNLIFYGLLDSSNENWSQTETLIRNTLCRILDLNLSGEAISRAHRLGSYIPNNCRPIITKFSSSKSKDCVLFKRPKFRGSGISVGEDFCRATRLSRKNLVEFGKASGQRFSLRLNKLHVNNKSYVYCPATDSVCEVDSNEPHVPISDTTTPSTSIARPPVT
ncbi:uncharacterized protein LOC121048313 [Ixodes scapularis]|uniref:uncharacterized protein LOC121048313 n=1 Tax=Ixodes scapularis TaxID=6945 RepID=UPI001AD6E27F|nr:uncharacterized protein LOC121048313 [Ixodes scapularis]